MQDTGKRGRIYAAFLEDWDNYPRRMGNKNNAWIGYKKLVGPNLELKRVEFKQKTERMLEVINNKRFIPWAETWFTQWHNYCFDDSYIPKPIDQGMKDIIDEEINKNKGRK